MASNKRIRNSESRRNAPEENRESKKANQEVEENEV